MDKNQSDKYRIPRVVGEYDSAKRRDKGLPGRIGEAVMRAASRVVTTGKEYAKRIGADAKRPENDKGLMGKLGFPGNPENPTGASEGSTDTSKPGANESKTEKRNVNALGESATLEDSNEGKEMKSGDNPEGLTPYEQAMRDKYLGDEYDEAEYGDDKPEKNERVEDLNSEGATYVDDTPTEKIDLKTYEAATNLKIARSRFAKASVAVESHFFKRFFGGKKRQAELEAATEQLKQCELEYMRLKFADKIEAAKQDPEKQAELAAEMAQAAFASMQETSRTTTDKYDSMLDDRGKFKKAAAKVGKWFNKGGKIAQWLKLGGAGFAVGATTAAFAGWPITVAVGVVTKLGVAGATKQAVLEEHRGEDRIDADASLGTIDPSFEKAVANMKIDDVMKRAVNVSVDNLKGVSTERRDALRKKVLSSSGKYAVGLVLGGLAGKYVGDWASQSGGKELKTHLLEKVDNTKPGSVDPVGNYTPGLDSLYGYDPSKHEFLWQWAESVYGEGNGTSGIMHTVDVLRDNGYAVDIINNPNGSFSVVVDGVGDTKGLVEIFSQFVN